MTHDTTSKARSSLARSLVIAAVALAGCGSSNPPVTPDASAECTTIGTATGQFTFGTATCDSCMSTSCCDQVTACLTGVVDTGHPCADLLSCIAVCVRAGGGQQDCVLSCAMQHPTGVSAGITLQNCMQASCAMACPSS